MRVLSKFFFDKIFFLYFTSISIDHILISYGTNYPGFHTCLLHGEISRQTLPWQFDNFTYEIINKRCNFAPKLRSDLSPMIQVFMKKSQ